MAEIKNVTRAGGTEINPLNENQVGDRNAQRIPQNNARANQADLPIGQPTDTRQPVDTANQQVQPKILPDAATGRDATQFEAAKQLSALGNASATDRLLGLDLRPTMVGALASPPGNSEFLRHLSPQMRRTMMRKMLSKQRERMRRLARFLREREQSEEDQSNEERRESFAEMIAEPVKPDQAQLAKAVSDIDKTARMLDILDEMLAMQDYTISQIGTFSQG